jgi:4-hydroxybutyryl-CoA dehydratase/vinylacetyl-CoA-Delta-isomerase
MISNAEIPYSCALAAAVEGKKHESGAYLPDILPVEVGKVYAARKLGENRYYMQEAAGGSARTMPLEKDFQNPETKRYLEKYLKGKEGMPAEHRIRALRLIYDLTASGYAGWNHAMRICEGGAPQALRLGTLAGYALERSKARAKRAAGIE